MSQSGWNGQNSGFRGDATLRCFAACTLLIGSLAWSTCQVSGQPPTSSVQAAEPLLSTPITLSVDEQAVGELMREILAAASPAGVPADRDLPVSIRSLWLDRRVDLSVRVNLIEAATPAAKVILELAQRQNLAVFPLPGVLLIGRDEWVDTTVGHLVPGSDKADDLISIAWPVGTTAGEVMALMLAAPTAKVAGATVTDLAAVMPAADAAGSSSFAPSWVPHDIWPAGRLISVDRTLAVSLLLAQFHCALKPATRLETLRGSATLPAGVQTWTELPPGKAFTLSYPTGGSAQAIRESLASVKPRAAIRVTGKNLLINTTPSNHRRAIAVHWRVTAEKAQAAPLLNEPEAVFDLKLINKPAAVVLRQLAGAAGKKLRIETAAELASEQLVSLDAQQKTLRELAEIVAESVGLSVRWSDKEAVVSR